MLKVFPARLYHLTLLTLGFIVFWLVLEQATRRSTRREAPRRRRTCPKMVSSTIVILFCCRGALANGTSTVIPWGPCDRDRRVVRSPKRPPRHQNGVAGAHTGFRFRPDIEGFPRRHSRSSLLHALSPPHCFVGVDVSSSIWLPHLFLLVEHFRFGDISLRGF